MPTRDNRGRNAALKLWLLEWADQHGIQLRRVAQANSLAAAFSPSRRQGSLEGVPGWTLRASAQSGRFDLATAAAQLERDRVDNGDAFAASFVEFRRTSNPYDEHSPYVLMSVETWAALVHALAGTQDPASDLKREGR